MTDELLKKIKLAAVQVDDYINFPKIAAKINSKPVRFVVSSFELVDGYVFRVALTEAVELIPEKAHPVVEAWLDAFLAKDYLLLVDTTGGFLAELNLIPMVEFEEEKNVYIALLTALVKLIPPMTRPDEAAA